MPSTLPPTVKSLALVAFAGLAIAVAVEAVEIGVEAPADATTP